MTKARRYDRRLTRAEAAAHVIANARIEGMELSDESQAVLSKWTAGQMSTEDLQAWKKERVRLVTERNLVRARTARTGG